MHTRAVEATCRENPKFMHQLEGHKVPDHYTLARFRSRVLCSEIGEDLLRLVVELLMVTLFSLLVNNRQRLTQHNPSSDAAQSLRNRCSIWPVLVHSLAGIFITRGGVVAAYVDHLIAAGGELLLSLHNTSISMNSWGSFPEQILLHWDFPAENLQPLIHCLHH